MINTLIKNRKGFTLIELIVTIALLAVISVISVVSVNYVIVESKVSDCENLFKNIEVATKDYFGDNRYNLSELSVYKKSDDENKYSINAGVLISEKYLSGTLVNPFTDKNIDNEDIIINVWLKEDYTIDSINIMNSSDEEIDCSMEDTLPSYD